MSLFGRRRWFVLAGGITLAFAVVSLTVPRGPVLTAIGDVGYFLVTLAVGVAMRANAWSTRGVNRRFWTLLGSGCILWAAVLARWAYYEGASQPNGPPGSFMD